MNIEILESLPSREILAQRLEKQRDRLFYADGIIGTVLTTLRDTDLENGSLSSRDVCHVRFALKAAQEMVDDVAGQLETDVALDVATAEEQS
jgi:hypothetical protein